MHVQSNQMQAHTVVPSPHHKVTLWRTVHAVKDVGAMCWIVTAQACVPAFECMCVRVCAHTCPRVSPHYLLLPAPGDSAPSLHLSSWLATICLSTSSSLVSRSNWSSCKQTHKPKYIYIKKIKKIKGPEICSRLTARRCTFTVIQEWEADSFASQCRLAMTHKRSDRCCK